MFKKAGVYALALGFAALATGGMYLDSEAASPVATKRIISGDEAHANVTRLLTEIPWYTDLDYASKKAQAEGKPIFWVHALGKLNSTT